MGGAAFQYHSIQCFYPLFSFTEFIVQFPNKSFNFIESETRPLMSSCAVFTDILETYFTEF